MTWRPKVATFKTSSWSLNEIKNLANNNKTTQITASEWARMEVTRKMQTFNGKQFSISCDICSLFMLEYVKCILHRFDSAVVLSPPEFSFLFEHRVFFNANEVNLTICRFPLQNYKFSVSFRPECILPPQKQLCNNTIAVQNIQNYSKNIRKNNCWQTNFKFNSEQFVHLFACLLGRNSL